MVFAAYQIGHNNGMAEGSAYTDSQRIGAFIQPSANIGFAYDFVERNKPQTANVWLSSDNVVVLAGEAVDAKGIRGFEPVGFNATIVVILPSTTDDGRYDVTVTPGSTTPIHMWYRLKPDHPVLDEKFVMDMAKIVGWPCKTPTICDGARVIGIRNHAVMYNSSVFAAHPQH